MTFSDHRATIDLAQFTEFTEAHRDERSVLDRPSSHAQRLRGGGEA